MQLKIPQKFLDMFGTNIDYKKGNKHICNGEIVGARFPEGTEFIVNWKEGVKYYPIQFKIKPTDGFNRNRCIWTTSFNSGIPLGYDNSKKEIERWKGFGKQVRKEDSHEA